MTPHLSLIVLRTSQTEAMLSFYSGLGLQFAKEQHGKGPVHYAAQLGGVVIEVYPSTDGTAPERHGGGATMLGFRVKSVDATLALLRGLAVCDVPAPKSGPFGKRAVVSDPDGRAVELVEAEP